MLKKLAYLTLAFVLLTIGNSFAAPLHKMTLPWPEAGQEIDLEQLQAEIAVIIPVVAISSSPGKSLHIYTSRELTVQERRDVKKITLMHIPEPEPVLPTIEERLAALEEMLFQIDMDKLLRVIEIYGE